MTLTATKGEAISVPGVADAPLVSSVSKRRAASLPTLKLVHIWPLLAVAAPFTLTASGQVGLVDLGWTLASGRWMVEHGQLLANHNPFNSAPVVATQVNAQWLGQLVYFALFATGDYELVHFGTAAAAALTFGLVLSAAHRASGSVRAASAACIAVLLLCATNFGDRTQTLAYPIFAWFLHVAWHARSVPHTRLLWTLPPLIAVWANVHGSYFLGLAVVGALAVEAQVEKRLNRSLLAAAIACGLATLVTPYGQGLLLYVVRMGSNPIIRDFLGEWAATNVGIREGVLFFVSVAVAAALLLASKKSVSVFEWLILAAFGVLALLGVRSVIWWGLAIAPILARHGVAAFSILSRKQVANNHRERPVLNALIALLVMLVVGLSFPWARPINPFLQADRKPLVSPGIPVGVGAFLREQPLPGKLLNESGWGGYFDWVAYPTNQPYIDARVELYPTDVWMDYFWMLYPSADWAALMDRYEINALVLSPEINSVLVGLVRQQPNVWRVVYEDDQAVVFVREGASTRAASASFAPN